jgi:hypothetical protein
VLLFLFFTGQLMAGITAASAEHFQWKKNERRKRPRSAAPPLLMD